MVRNFYLKNVKLLYMMDINDLVKHSFYFLIKPPHDRDNFSFKYDDICNINMIIIIYTCIIMFFFKKKYDNLVNLHLYFFFVFKFQLSLWLHKIELLSYDSINKVNFTTTRKYFFNDSYIKFLTTIIICARI